MELNKFNLLFTRRKTVGLFDGLNNSKGELKEKPIHFRETRKLQKKREEKENVRDRLEPIQRRNWNIYDGTRPNQRNPMFPDTGDNPTLEGGQIRENIGKKMFLLTSGVRAKAWIMPYLVMPLVSCQNT